MAVIFEFKRGFGIFMLRDRGSRHCRGAGGRGPRAACCGRGPRGALQPRRREPPTALPRCQSNPKYHKVQQKRPTYVPRPRSKINRGARHLTSYRRHAVQRPACAERSTDTMRSGSISYISPSGTPRSCNGLK